jgi:hypothetical protein
MLTSAEERTPEESKFPMVNCFLNGLMSEIFVEDDSITRSRKVCPFNFEVISSHRFGFKFRSVWASLTSILLSQLLIGDICGVC